MKQNNFRGLPDLAIANGATTPNPGFPGVLVWSTTLASIVSWNGTSWNIQPTSKLLAKISTVFASTASSAAVQIVLSLSIPANFLVAGKTFCINLSGTQSQSAAATNVSGYIFVNGTQLVTAAVACGTAAQTNRSLIISGNVMWNGTNYVGNLTTAVSGILQVGAANVTGVAVAASTAHNIDIRVNCSVANAANIIRSLAAYIEEL